LTLCVGYVYSGLPTDGSLKLNIIVYGTGCTRDLGYSSRITSLCEKWANNSVYSRTLLKECFQCNIDHKISSRHPFPSPLGTCALVHNCQQLQDNFLITVTARSHKDQVQLANESFFYSVLTVPWDRDAVWGASLARQKDCHIM